MALPNDAINVTPGSGAVVATQLVSAKEYQVVMLAYPDGHINGSLPQYRMICPAQAVGANKVFLDLFNATGSGGTLRTNNPALSANITARSSPTGGATAGALIGQRWVFTEETSAPSGIAGTLGAEFVRNEGADLIVRENSGLRFVQGTVASVGNLSFEITFEVF